MGAAGALFDRFGSYDGLFALCIALSLVGSLLIPLVKPRPRSES